MRRPLLILLAVALVTTLPVVSAEAGDGNWLLRVSAAFINADSGVTTGIGPQTGVRASLGIDVGGGVSLERLLNHRLGIELGIMGSAPKLDVRIGGGGSPGEVEADITSLVPVTLGLNVHLIDGAGGVDVRFGPLLAWVSYGGLESVTGHWPWIDRSEYEGNTEISDRSSTRIGSDTDLTWGLNLGVEMPFGVKRRWSGHVGLMYLDTSFDLGTGEPGDAQRLTVDPLIFKLGFGYRF